MKLEVKKTGPIKRELRFEIPKERVSQTLNDVYSELAKSAKFTGFRQGKVPRHILESQHGKYAQEEAIRKLIPEVYHEGLKKENIQPIDLPEIHDVDFKNGIVTFTAKLELRPEIKLKDYKGIKVKRKSSEISEEEINKTLEFFKKGHGEKEETKIDEAFAHGLGYPSLDDFKKSLARQLELDKDRQNRADIENQIIEYLVKNNKFDMPEALVHRQLHHRMDEAVKRMKQQGVSEEEIQKKQKELHTDLHPSVEKDVKVYLILDKIAELEKLEIKEGENLPAKVMEFLLKEAAWEK